MNKNMLFLTLLSVVGVFAIRSAADLACQKHIVNGTVIDEDQTWQNDIEDHSFDVVVSAFRNIYGPLETNCVPVKYENTVNAIKNDQTFVRSWNYQTCSEFGWYQTIDSDNLPFGSLLPVDYYLRLCQDVFGPKFTNASIENNIKHTNDMFGGFDLSVTNVYLTYGSLDPWHRMGILKDINEHSPSTVISDIAHCQDQGSIDYKKDSKELIRLKITVKKLVKKWLKQ